MNIQEHAELALLNVEYSKADCDVMLMLATNMQSLRHLSNVGDQLMAAKLSLLYVLSELENPATLHPTATPN